MNKVRVFLRGFFQCSPDDFEPIMESIVVESPELSKSLKSGYRIIGGEKETSDTKENKINSQQQSDLGMFNFETKCNDE